MSDEVPIEADAGADQPQAEQVESPAVDIQPEENVNPDPNDVDLSPGVDNELPPQEENKDDEEHKSVVDGEGDQDGGQVDGQDGGHDEPKVDGEDHDQENQSQKQESKPASPKR